MIELEGGRAGQIVRRGDEVLRPAGAWTPTVHRFLRHLRASGFAGAPVPLAIDGGQEAVSYLEGRVCEDLADPLTGSPAMLRSAAMLLRRFHDASRGFLESDGDPRSWMLPAVEPMELVCHGDFAPYNVVTEGEAAVGLIDFDAAHPAPTAWDSLMRSIAGRRSPIRSGRARSMTARNSFVARGSSAMLMAQTWRRGGNCRR